jgi:hypothetical protein
MSGVRLFNRIYGQKPDGVERPFGEIVLIHESDSRCGMSPMWGISHFLAEKVFC